MGGSSQLESINSIISSIAAIKPTMATETKEALFRYLIYNYEDITHLEYTHPVPTFLCTPMPSQRDSRQYLDAFVDVLSIVNAQHHEECMSKITTPCVICGMAVKDALKSPMSYLHLAQPMIVIKTSQICGDKRCEMQARAQMSEMQQKVVGDAVKSGGAIYDPMSCESCGKANAKRCAGCGQVAYCNEYCQRACWKKHKKRCYRRKAVDAEDPVDLPYEAI